MKIWRFFIVIFFIDNTFSIIKIPFKVIENKNKNSFMENLMELNILSKITIGSPSKEMDININFSHYNLYMSGNSIPNHLYNEKESSSYRKLSDLKKYYFEPFNKGILSSDKIKIGNFKSEMNYILATEGGNYIKQCSIGLKPIYDEQKEKDIANIIDFLKSNNYINSYTFTITFNKKTKNEQTGEIIIGEYPHEYSKDEYKSEYYQKMNIEKSGVNLYWGIKVNEIRLNNIKK